MGQRLGAGKLRSLEARALWLQQKLQKGLLELRKCSGSLSPADLGTKACSSNTLAQLLPLCGMRSHMPGDVSVAAVAQASGRKEARSRDMIASIVADVLAVVVSRIGSSM